MRASQTVEMPTFIQNKIEEIKAHVAWHSDLTGSEAEAILSNMPDMTYLLRQGEKADHFYLTYVSNGTNFIHIPFVIDYTSQKWFYRNFCPHFGDSLKVFIPEIMHKEENTCYPLAAFAGK